MTMHDRDCDDEHINDIANNEESENEINETKNNKNI